MTALDGVRAFDREAGLVTVEAGVSIAGLVRHTLPHGWFPAVVPGTRWVTVGGALAADVHGKNHHVDGGFAEHTLAFELVTPDGERREVTPHGDPEAWQATVGGMGLTGVVTAATLRLIAVRSPVVREELSRAADLDELLARMSRDDQRHRYSVAWVDCATARGRGLLMHGDHAAEPGPAPALAPPRLRAPRWAPGALLGRATVRAFDAVWFQLKPRVRRSDLVPLASFFWPLDGVQGWNRLYGARGLVQYQCVVPPGAEDVLRAMLDRSRAAGIASTLAVLKRLGPGTAPLSFPMAGWTLALDLPAGARGLAALLDGFDELVAGAGGRVYLAKDARMRANTLRAMYPALDRWRAARASLDPRGVMRSDLSRRLELA
ncbi:MAG: decaprenylphospho-beta-D-ribofuranose 2-oxidase [Solirubrobacteraceae bacterium]|jgi:decaprenylphospho-beta-D-ribofuranose 2-oxidase|nr:decaprenylphospho-beta-D-ribofuranose 2-oxidase [Solirubrobacteraceae bacterium]